MKKIVFKPWVETTISVIILLQFVLCATEPSGDTVAWLLFETINISVMLVNICLLAKFGRKEQA